MPGGAAGGERRGQNTSHPSALITATGELPREENQVARSQSRGRTALISGQPTLAATPHRCCSSGLWEIFISSLKATWDKPVASRKTDPAKGFLISRCLEKPVKTISKGRWLREGCRNLVRQSTCVGHSSCPEHSPTLPPTRTDKRDSRTPTMPQLRAGRGDQRVLARGQPQSSPANSTTSLHAALNRLFPPPHRNSRGSRDPPSSLFLSINRPCPEAFGKYSDKPLFPRSADSWLSQNSEATTQNNLSSETLKECHRLSQKLAEASWSLLGPALSWLLADWNACGFNLYSAQVLNALSTTQKITAKQTRKGVNDKPGLKMPASKR